MSDDLDDLLRRSMKTLDDQVPSGYFEDLPKQTLARLEDSSMQTTGTSKDSSATGVPPQERDEDSGLHDIRSMATSTKMRLSSRRTTSPPADDVLASSSAGWKAVALPEPARMVALPELTELPAASEVARLDKLSKQERTSAKKLANAAAEVSTSAATPVAVAAPAAVARPAVSEETAAPVTPIIGARFAKPQQKSKTGLFVVLGLGLAAAAGGAFWFTTQQDKDAPATVAAVEPAPAQPQAVVAQPIEEPVAAPPAVPEPEPAPVAIATGAPEEAAAAAPERDVAKKPAKADRKGKGKDEGESALKQIETKPTDPGAKKQVAKDGEPSFDDLLKEAGVSGEKKVVKTALDKKSLSGGDIKTGMSAVAGKAQGCYNGTQGQATVRLTVAPTGEVQKVTVTGPFAGTQVGNCVANVVKSAKFPPWDGGPQTFGYSYLLAAE